MTAFATCAFTGCYEKISYEPTTDITRQRYCNHHMKLMVQRLRVKECNQSGHNGLYINVVPKAVPTDVIPPEKIIILMCSICRTRKEIPFGQWEIGYPCRCGGKMLYHKDKVVRCSDDY